MNDLVFNNSNNDKQAMLARLILNKNDKNLLSAARSFKEITNVFVFNADEESVQNYYKKIVQKHRNLNTRRSYILNLKRIFKMCVNREIMPCNYVQRLEDDGIIRIPKSERTAKPLLVSSDKIDTVLKSDKISNREKSVIMFLANTGCRSSELLELKKSDFKLIAGNYTINMLMPKVTRNRILEIKSEFYDYLNENINKVTIDKKDKILEGESFLCNKFSEQMSRNGLEKMVTKIWHKIFPDEKVGAHQFRHFFITYKIVVEKLSLERVRVMVGHKDIASTARYIHDLPDYSDFNIFTPSKNTKSDNGNIVKSWLSYMDAPMDVLAPKHSRKTNIKPMSDNDLTNEFALSNEDEEEVIVPHDEDLAKLFAEED